MEIERRSANITREYQRFMRREKGGHRETDRPRGTLTMFQRWRRSRSLWVKLSSKEEI